MKRSNCSALLSALLVPLAASLALTLGLVSCGSDEGNTATNEQGPCQGVTCSGHGTCEVKEGKATCNCESDYYAKGLECLPQAGGPSCEGVTCSGHGACVIEQGKPTCQCEPSYHAEGVECVPDSTGPSCDGITCSDHGQCVIENGKPMCKCDDGYHAAALNCVADSADPCNGVTCSGHGTCEVKDGKASCDCESGYHANGLECVADSSDSCDGVDCSGHGKCKVVGGKATCECDSGYEPKGLTCVPDPCRVHRTTRQCLSDANCTWVYDEQICGDDYTCANQSKFICSIRSQCQWKDNKCQKKDSGFSKPVTCEDFGTNRKLCFNHPNRPGLLCCWDGRKCVSNTCIYYGAIDEFNDKINPDCIKNGTCKCTKHANLCVQKPAAMDKKFTTYSCVCKHGSVGNGGEDPIESKYYTTPPFHK